MRYSEELKITDPVAERLFGRSVSLIFDGVGPGGLSPMVAEAVMIGVLILGMRTFGRRR
jgi:hypothetical protein